MGAMALESSSFKILTESIIQSGECARCGACVGLCPYLDLYEGTLVFPDACNLDNGRCLNFCPKGPLDLDGLTRHVRGHDYEGSPLGSYMKIVMARGTHTTGPQYGGVVTALVQAAMERQEGTAALLTAWRSHPTPEGVIVESPGDVPHHSGVHYAGGYSLAALNRYRKSNPAPITVVGLPCQILALRRMHAFDYPENPHWGKGDFVIGLFCTWALAPRPFREEMRRRFGERAVVRYDIPPPPANRFDITFEDGETVEIPLEEIRPFINPGCQTCLDMTAELADISVGAAEGFDGWNTVLIRTQRGAAMFDRLVDTGGIEVRDLPEASVAHLTKAAAMKKKRALDALESKGASQAWLTMSGSAHETIRNAHPFEER